MYELSIGYISFNTNVWIVHRLYFIRDWSIRI